MSEGDEDYTSIMYGVIPSWSSLFLFVVNPDADHLVAQPQLVITHSRDSSHPTSHVAPDVRTPRDEPHAEQQCMARDAGVCDSTRRHACAPYFSTPRPRPTTIAPTCASATHRSDRRSHRRRHFLSFPLPLLALRCRCARSRLAAVWLGSRGSGPLHARHQTALEEHEASQRHSQEVTNGSRGQRAGTEWWPRANIVPLTRFSPLAASLV